MGLFRKQDTGPVDDAAPEQDRKEKKAAKKRNRIYCPGCGAKNDVSETRRCRLCGSLLVADVEGGGIGGLDAVSGFTDAEAPSPPAPPPTPDPVVASPLAVPATEEANAGFLIPAAGQALDQDIAFEDDEDVITFDPDAPFDPDALLSVVERPVDLPDPPPPPPPPPDEKFDPDGLDAGWPAPRDDDRT